MRFGVLQCMVDLDLWPSDSCLPDLIIEIEDSSLYRCHYSVTAPKDGLRLIKYSFYFEVVNFLLHDWLIAPDDPDSNRITRRDQTMEWNGSPTQLATLKWWKPSMALPMTTWLFDRGLYGFGPGVQKHLKANKFIVRTIGHMIDSKMLLGNWAVICLLLWISLAASNIC